MVRHPPRSTRSDTRFPYPTLFRSRDVDAAIKAGINVPVPKDPGGGFTHEQHKRNYRIIFEGGQLYRLIGDARYRDHVRDLLLAYADLYPKLGPHPAKANQNAGRIFWQSLNDSVFLVNAVQGYAQIRDRKSTRLNSSH